MYYSLRQNVILALDNGDLVMLATQNPSVRIILSKVTALVLDFFDGTSSTAEIAHMLEVVLGLKPEAARSVVEEVAWRYVQFLGGSQEKASTPRHGRWVDPMIILSHKTQHQPWRQDVPGAVDWVVTSQCDRRCVYCYRDAPMTGRVTDDYLSTGEMFRFLDEAKTAGVRDFTLNGGEPFLRSDAVAVADRALQHGMRVMAYTKHHFSIEEARFLCRSGRPRIYFSLDSVDPKIALFLTGSRNFVDEAKDSIRNLVAAGAEVFVATVATRVNVSGLPELFDGIAQLGVAGFRVAPIKPSLRKWRNDLDLLPEQWEQLDAILTQYRDSIEGILVTRRSRTQDHNPVLPTALKTTGCAQGLNSLVIHPTGDVALCDKVLDPRLVVGNIKQQSLMEIWHSPRMYEALLPNMDKYLGTPCYDCSYFDECSKRGRCWFSSLMGTGEVFGPDEFCERDDVPTKRVVYID